MSEPSRVRIVVARYGEEIIGGAEAHARAVAFRLAGRGHRVSVLTSCAVDEATWRNALPAGRSLDGAVEVHRFRTRLRRRPRTFHQLTRAFFRLPPAVRWEAVWLALQGPWLPSLDLALRGEPFTPTLFVGYLYRPTVRGLGEVRGPRLLLPTAHDERALRLRSVGAALARCHGIWYATPEERALVERIHPGAARVEAAVGNVGVEPPREVDPGGFRRRHRVDGPYLLYGGRATAGKGVDELIAGVRRLRDRRPDVHLVLIGDAIADAAGGAGRDRGVVALGRLEDGERWNAIAGAAAVVVPSFAESLSLLALEAWAVGRPALLNAATPVLRGQAERSGGALLYTGSAGLAKAAARVVDDEALAGRLGDAGRSWVAREYRWDAALGRFEALLASGMERAARERADAARGRRGPAGAAAG